MKLRQDKDFVYGVKSVDFLLEREDEVEANRSDRTSRHNSRRSADFESSKLIENLGKDNTSVVSNNWSDLYDNLFQNNNSNLQSSEFVAGAISNLSLSQSQSQVQITDAGASTSSDFVNIFTEQGYRHNSSTRLDFLEVEDCFLSASPTVRIDTSDMGSDNCGECDACLDHQPCTVLVNKQEDTVSNQEVMTALLDAVSKVNKLTDKVISLEKHIVKQDKKIEKIIDSGKEDSSQESTKVKAKPGKVKVNRVEEEKARQLKLLQERLRAKNVSSSSEKEESSEAESVDLKAMKKKMSRKQRDLCGRKVNARLSEAGALFPLDDFETSSSTGTESDIGKSCRRKNLIKSGAKVKKRPVVQTELWPHTIANEDDGEEVTSENISLAKFFSCFSYILVSCSSKIESRGRSALLHAVSIVLEYLHWSDARTFHNLVMVKIEQGRLDWASEFSGLAEGFIDKKVRLSLKSKRYPACASSSYRSGYSNKNIGKGYSSSFKGNGDSGRNKSLHEVICWQWNNGTCTYGDNCKRWHVCRVCAEAGKLGELHKASTHDSSGSRARPSERP